MALIEVDKLIMPISDGLPCGPDLEYDQSFLELERLIQGNPERQVGNAIIPAEEPNWNQVGEACNQLLARTKDLRVLMFLQAAGIKISGLPELESGLKVLKTWLDKYWTQLHPQIDPAEEGDLTQRANVFQIFAPAIGERGEGMLCKILRETPFINSRQLGRFGWREIALASGELPPVNPTVHKIQMSAIESAVKDCNAEELSQALQAAVNSSVLLMEIEKLLDRHFQNGNSADFSSFRKTLNSIIKHLEKFMGKSGQPTSDGAEASSAPQTRTEAAHGAASNGQITSKEDVIRIIDQICDFYSRTEPSSPVPIVLKRAQRLVGKDFWQIVADLSPSALDSIKNISGTDGPEEKPAS